MAPTTVPYNETISLTTSDGTIILVQGSDNPWSLDLNTLVTIVFGIITITFQAAQMYHRRRRKTAEFNQDDIENGEESLLPHRQEAQLTPWRPPYNWEELEEYQSPEAAREQSAPAMSTRSRSQRQVFRRDGSVQSGEMGYFQPGYVYRRTPWQSKDWVGGPNSGPPPDGPAHDRHYAQRRRPGFV